MFAGIYDAVAKLTADGKMTRTVVFEQIGRGTGRKAGTLSVNYYYVARKRGAKLRRRHGRPKMDASARCVGAGSSRIEAARRRFLAA